MDRPYFDAAGLESVFVGNSALAKSFAGADASRLGQTLGLASDEPILLVLPGSRPSEIERVMPVFEDTVRRLKVERPDLAVVVPVASTVADAVRARVAANHAAPHAVLDHLAASPRKTVPALGAMLRSAELDGCSSYASPEQLKGRREFMGPPSDIYSLGVVFYEMLTGELPADKLQPPSRRVQVDVRIDEIIVLQHPRDAKQFYVPYQPAECIFESASQTHRWLQRYAARRLRPGLPPYI